MPPDFSCQNLRGRSFRGKNLTGVNFSGADIRGADFTGANLIGANFTHAKAGIERRWEIGWLIIFLMLSIIPGFCFQVCSHYWIDVVENYSSEKVFTCIGSFITLLAFFILTLNQGLIAGFKLLIVILTAAVASAPIASEAVLASGAVVAAVAGVTSSAVIVVGVSAVVNTGAILGTIVVTIGMALLAAKGKALVVTFMLTIILAGVSAYIGWRALLEDKKYVFFSLKA
ncbi:pentapeptide repeat-containing protein [Nostoc punctiforme UO1]|uniref:pentapeptide repeat-containing protein n=1 Tax=Nostoc punctiforme TaxID=272131 RepID=UPI00309FD607